VVTATDITAQAMALTAENASVQDLPVDIVRTNAESMGFADASFDYVLSWGVVHHSPNTESALAEIARILKPGGRGLIMVYHKTSLVYYLRGLYWLIVRGKLLKGYNLKTVQDFCVDGYYHRHFGKREMARCLSDVGLRPVNIFATQQSTPLIPGITGSLDRALKKAFGWYLVAEIERPA
jgi:ubiquinone/menaquinone biosynthesis C-methylase UbiE